MGLSVFASSIYLFSSDGNDETETSNTVSNALSEEIEELKAKKELFENMIVLTVPEEKLLLSEMENELYKSFGYISNYVNNEDGSITYTFLYPEAKTYFDNVIFAKITSEIENLYNIEIETEDFKTFKINGAKQNKEQEISDKIKEKFEEYKVYKEVKISEIIFIN